MSRFPVMRAVLDFTSVHNAIGAKRMLAARDELAANDNDLDELERARDWIREHGTPYGDPDEGPVTVDDALQQTFFWGDGAWTAAGKAEERQVELKRALQIVGGLLEFEGDVAGAMRVIHDTIEEKSANRTWRVLHEIGIERVRQEKLREEGRFKHTCADPDWDEGEKLACLAEEFGEVAKALLHRRELVSDGGGDLRTELIQVAAVATAWAEALA